MSAGLPSDVVEEKVPVAPTGLLGKLALKAGQMTDAAGNHTKRKLSNC